MVKNQATKSDFGGKGVWDYYQVTKKGILKVAFRQDRTFKSFEDS